MEFILDGYLKHAAHAGRKYVFSEKYVRFVTALDLITCLV